jgi:hypothetical protein
MMKAVVAVALALVTPVSARWTGNVLIYNLLANRTIEWMGANATGKNGEELFSISCMTQRHFSVHALLSLAHALVPSNGQAPLLPRALQMRFSLFCMWVWPS